MSFEFVGATILELALGEIISGPPDLIKKVLLAQSSERVDCGANVQSSQSSERCLRYQIVLS